MKKRIFSLLLALCLVAGMLPTTVLAEGSTPDPTPISVTVNNCTNGTATVNAPDQWYEGANRFSVISKLPCVVIVEHSDGTDNRLNCGEIDAATGHYRFFVNAVDGDTISIAVKGDVNLDGVVTNIVYERIYDGAGMAWPIYTFYSLNSDGTRTSERLSDNSLYNSGEFDVAKLSAHLSDPQSNTLSTLQKYAADINCDGLVNQTDVDFLKNYTSSSDTSVSWDVQYDCYTITFDTGDGGSTVSAQKVLEGEQASAPTDPTKEDCIFGGWYNGDTEFDFANTPVIENITLTAKWSEKSDISFNTNSQSYTYNGSAQAFSITGTSVTGFDISYQQNGQTVTNPTNAGSYDVIITRAEDDTYKAVDVTISNGLVINPAAPAENPAKKTTARVIKGKTLADAAVTNGEILALDGTTVLTGTFAWVDSTKVMSADGIEQMVFTPDSTNYAPITIDVAVSAYSTGGGSSTPTYAPTVNQPDNGTVTVSPKSPKKGDTVTITPKPEAGYTVEQILVTDKDGDPVEVTNNGDGTYSFTQPAGKVDVEITFMEDNTMLNFFVDVPADAYYYDAVLWAAENGITGGTSDTTFSPDAPCTRAQIVTFLWRAAGSPVVNYAMNFSDVPADAYYAEAVRWAVSQGITSGTGNGMFSPDATCTRAQAMTFIYRSVQAQGGGMQGAWMFQNPFSDVDLENYYGEAVMWAVANGVTSGTSSTTFSPDADCTRAQIVTFLYRSMK